MVRQGQRDACSRHMEMEDASTAIPDEKGSVRDDVINLEFFY